MTFTAIDFETATAARNSACAVGLVTVENGAITDRYYSLIRPPENQYAWHNIQVHGIKPEETADALPFRDLFLTELLPRIDNQLLVAHNAPFDRSVLTASLVSADLPSATYADPTRWVCTLRLYRQKGYNPCRLSDCCAALNIALDHHHALSDAIGCAELYLRSA